MADNNNEESIRKESEARDKSTDSSKKLADALDDLIRRSKSAEDKFKSLNKELDRGKKKYADIAEELSDLRDSIEDVTDVAKKKVLLDQLEIKEGRARSATLTKLAVDGMAGIVGGLAAGATQVSKSLISSYQSNAGAFDMASDAAVAGIDATFATAKGLANSATIAGGALSMIPGWTKLIGIGLTAIGAVTTLLVEKLSDNAKAVVQIGMKELEATSKFYSTAINAGALFAEGITEFRNTAGDANLTQGEFAKVMAENNTIFAMYGGTVGNGAKKFADASREMGRFREGLINLGYSYEEQAEGLAQVMQLNALQGNASRKTGAELAVETDKYLTNLRVISAFTGEDAKKAQARATAASQQSAVDSKLRKMDDNARDRFQSMVKLLPEEMQQGLQQMFLAGTITDPELAAAFSNNAAVMELFNKAVQYTNDSTIDAGKATENLKNDLSRVSAAGLKQADASADSVGASNLLTGQFQKYNKAVEASQELFLKGTQLQKDSNAEADKAKNTKDPLTRSVADATKAAQEIKLLIQKEMTPAITGFVAAFNNGRDDIIKGVKTLISAFNGGPTQRPPSEGTDKRNENKPGAQKRPDGTSSNPYIPNQAPTTISNINDLIAWGGGITGDEAHFNKLDSGLKNRFLAMAQEYKTMSGGKQLTVSSGFRSEEEQARISSKSGIKADPGSSLHQQGLALDLNESDIIALKQMDLLSKYGLKNIHDPNHIEMLAKGGITNGLSIAGEAGPEAVIPLPDGRSVPVKMDTGELGSKMDEMIRLLKDQLDNSGKMLYAIQ